MFYGTWRKNFQLKLPSGGHPGIGSAPECRSAVFRREEHTVFSEIGLRNSAGLAFSCRNQELKFCYGTKKFFDTIRAFAAVRVGFFNEGFDRRLVLIGDLPLMLVDPVCTRFHRNWYSFGKFRYRFRLPALLNCLA